MSESMSELTVFVTLGLIESDTYVLYVGNSHKKALSKVFEGDTNPDVACPGYRIEIWVNEKLEGKVIVWAYNHKKNCDIHIRGISDIRCPYKELEQTLSDALDQNNL